VYFLDQEYSGLYNEDVWECIECYLNLPDNPHPDGNPLNHAHICELQQQDEQLLALQMKYPDNYVNLQLDDNVTEATGRTTACSASNIQTIMSTYNWMITLMTSSVIRKIPLNPIEKLHCLNQW
jgi:hypothetical protein